MLKNYLISAFRSAVRDKFYSILNIFGPATGITCAILIVLYTRDELTFDKYNNKCERIYRVESHYTFSGKDSRSAMISIALLPAMKDEFPEIKEFVRITNWGSGNTQVSYRDKKFIEDKIYFADSTLFRVFDYEFILGSPDKALNEPNTVVLTESFASRYFGKENPLGEILITNNFGSCRVTGVIKDLPANTHLRFDCLVSMVTRANIIGIDMFNSRISSLFWNVYTYGYVLMDENTRIEDLLNKFPGFYDKYMSSVGKQVSGTFLPEATRLDKVHFGSGLGADQPVGNFSYIIIFSLVGFFMLLISSLNYMNMATARSTARSKEVGLRKVSGAGRGTLIAQFIGESVLLIIIALLIAVIATIFLLPSFNMITEKALKIGNLFKPLTFSIVILIALFTGLISGSYPSFYLSSLSPADVLKSKINPNNGRGILRKILVVFQFAISGILIICTLVVSGQQNFIRNLDLGLNKENVLIIPVRDTAFINHKLQTFKDELLKIPDIESVTSAVTVPPELAASFVFLIEKEGDMPKIPTSFSIVDHDFFDVMKIKLSQGRNFDRSVTSDPAKAFIVNETAVKEFGWGDNAIGKKIRFGIDPVTKASIMSGEVIGVVKDFHFASLHNTIEPFIFMVSREPNLYFYLRISGNSIPLIIENIKKIQKDMGYTLPHEHYFFADKLTGMYKSENKLNTLFNIFSLMTIFIACLGLLGLTSYVTGQRSKETSLRKIMGSGVGQIIWLLIKDFLILVLLSNLISWPVAYWLMERWVSGFAYHVDFSISPFRWVTITPFLTSLLITLVISVITISSISIKAARTNPINSLSIE